MIQHIVDGFVGDPVEDYGFVTCEVPAGGIAVEEEVDFFFFGELREPGLYGVVESAVVELRGVDGIDLLFDSFNLALEDFPGFGNVFKACLQIKGFELLFEVVKLSGEGNGQRSDAGVKAHGYFFTFVFSGGEDGGGKGKSGSVIGIGSKELVRGAVGRRRRFGGIGAGININSGEREGGF